MIRKLPQCVGGFMKKLIFSCIALILVGFLLALSGCSKTVSGVIKPSQEIKTEFEVGNETVKLTELSLLSSKVNILIPETFCVMSEDMAKTKYPNERRPTIIYTNESGSVNVAFSYTENKATESQIPEYLNSFKQSFKNMYPSAKWYNSNVVLINEKTVGYMELVTPSIDTEIYNLLWFTDLDGKLLLSTFNCTKEQMDDWKPIAKTIMDSQQYFSNSNSIEQSTSNSSEFRVEDYPIQITCPDGWWQDESANFDLKCYNEDSSLGMSIFCYYEEDLSEDMTKTEYFVLQNQQLLDNRMNAGLIEEMTERQYRDKTITSVVYSAESDGTKNYYYFNLVSITDSDCFLWVLFNGMPSDIKADRDALDEILQAIKLTES